MIVTMKQKEYLILEAAIKVFNQYGFYEAKISNIAEEAGVGKGTVYEYFDSKKQLFERSILYITEQYIVEAREIIKKEKTVKEKLVLLAQYHGEFIEKYVQAGELIISRNSIISEEMIYKIMEARNTVYDFIDVLIEEGIHNGELRGDIDKKIMLLTLWGAITENYQEKIFFQKLSAQDVDAVGIINSVFRGIAGNY
ncbi:TetR/AcrR family transcriptional regulator [Clostridium formicaceticum]|uniref:Fatty acid metabolism regulator protein n=1 Tax=Clostridium formicaceticum TaxID=1497 RepID=A0AAC9RHW7_9CLOT|nr:TetR/AcrR family transcriptional regulator [Clostridium formicaceticum]AOY75543.1 hypothetical protein BJL90_06320 [Clostridium formicaceticum]ARE85839.1 Fatty acid metabolism regulator protein [Clostridium formicaceticum]